MNNVKIIPVNQDEGIKDVAALAKKIWFEHYSKIIDEGQIEYMVNKYQSKKAIKQQIKLEEYQYFIAEFDGEKAGYFGIQVKDGSIFLSKLYIDRSYRRMGIASYIIDFL